MKRLQGKTIAILLAAGMFGGALAAGNPEVIARVLDQELNVLALSAYARKQGVEGSGGYKMVRHEEERNILRTQVFAAVFRNDVEITDKEVENACAKRSKEMVRQGKKVPLSAVREQVRESLKGEKRGKAFRDYIAELKKKARITIDNAALSKV